MFPWNVSDPNNDRWVEELISHATPQLTLGEADYIRGMNEVERSLNTR